MPTLTIDTDVLQLALATHAQTHNEADPSGMLAGLALALGLDPTLWGLSKGALGRVLAAGGRLALGGLTQEALRTSGAIQNNTRTEDAVSALICIDPNLQLAVPERIEEALTAAGVEPDVVASLYFDDTRGQVYRQRITSKWQTLVHIALSGKLRNPTGFFRAVITRNIMLSRDYEPGKRREKKAAAPAIPTPDYCPAVGEPVQVMGALGALYTVVEHMQKGGNWLTRVLHPDGWDTDVPSRNLRPAEWRMA